MRHEEILDAMANTTDGIFAVGTDHKIVFWNKSAQKILGYEAKEVLGKSCNEVIAGEDINGNLICSKDCHIMRSVKNQKNPESFDMHTHTKSGASIWINVSVITILGSQPELDTVVHMFRDVTKNKTDLIRVKEILLDNYISNKAEKRYASVDISTPHKKLTAREIEILKCLAEGNNPNEISDKFYISISTLRKHIQNVYYKLEVHSMLEAVAKAKQINLI